MTKKEQKPLLKEQQKKTQHASGSDKSTISKKSSDSAISQLADLFALLTADPEQNINIIVRKTCEILNGACSLYNRLDDKNKSLITWSDFSAPQDLQREDIPDGHICYEATIKGNDRTVILGELAGTPYEKTDKNIEKYNLRSYLGHPVELNNKAIGALCIVDRTPRQFSDSEIQIIKALAKALSLEEARKQANDRLHKSKENFRNIFNATTDGIFIYDPKTRKVIDLNTSVCRLLGYGYDEILKLSPDHVSVTEEGYTKETLFKKIEKALIEGPQSFQWHARRKGGQPFWAQVDIRLEKIGGQERALGVFRDINDHVLSDLALKESEQRFKRLTEATFEAIFIFENGICIDANQAAADLFGYTTDELIGMKAIEGIAAESRETVREKMETDYEQPYLATAIRKDGSRFPAEFQGRMLEYQGKKLRVKAVRDITDRHKTESALKESQLMIRQILDAIPVRVFWKDLHSRYLGCNLPFARDAGFNKPEELVGKDDYTCGWKKEADLYRSDDQHVIESGIPKYAYEEPQTTPDGNTVWLRTSKIPLKNTAGKRIGLLGTYENITEKKLAEQALRESEEKYRNLIQHSTDAIYILFKRKFVLINEKFQEMFGFTLEEVNSPTFDFIHLVAEKSRPVIEERMRRFKAGEKLKPKYEFTAVTKYGEELEVETSVSHLKYKDGYASQGIIRDITMRKSLENQVRQSQKIEAVGRLAGGVAHDFNNLLTVINGYCELLLYRQLPEDVHEKVDQIYQAGIKASRLTSQLLAFSRKQVIQPKTVNLNTTITEMNKMLHRLLGEDIEIETVLNPGLGPVMADPGQLEQIIINLAVNARDAMPTGGKLFIESDNVRLDEEFVSEHMGSKSGQYVLLTIRDNGIGMDEETRSRIFEPFFTTKDRGKGTGLGLSTVYGIVKQNDGYIIVESEPDVGTVFKIYFPRINQTVNTTLKKTIQETDLGGTETILVVEDDPGVRKLTLSVLSRFGYHVLSAEDGEHALELVSREKPDIDLLLSDVIMPKMNGKELADHLSKLYPAMKIIFFSGYTDEGIVQHGILKAGTEFIHKPFSQNTLIEKIRTVLDKS